MEMIKDESSMEMTWIKDSIEVIKIEGSLEMTRLGGILDEQVKRVLEKYVSFFFRRNPGTRKSAHPIDMVLLKSL